MQAEALFAGICGFGVVVGKCAALPGPGVGFPVAPFLLRRLGFSTRRAAGASLVAILT